MKADARTLDAQSSEQDARAEMERRIERLRSVSLRIADSAILSFKERAVRCHDCFEETLDAESARYFYADTYDYPLFDESESKSKLLLCVRCYDARCSVES